MPAIRGPKSKTKARRHTRDLDQVHADLHIPNHLAKYKDTKLAEDLPALGEHYCVECAKWFEGEHNLVEHRKGKVHKRRVRALKAEPWTQKEAEAAAGFSAADNGKRPEAMTVDDVVLDDAPAPQKPAQRTQDVDDTAEYNAFFSVA